MYQTPVGIVRTPNMNILFGKLEMVLIADVYEEFQNVERSQYFHLGCHAFERSRVKHLESHIFRYSDELAGIEIKRPSRFVVGSRGFVNT